MAVNKTVNKRTNSHGAMRNYISQRSCIYCYRRSSCIWIYKSIWFFCTGKYCRYSESGYSDNYFVYYLYLCIS